MGGARAGAGRAGPSRHLRRAVALRADRPAGGLVRRAPRDEARPAEPARRRRRAPPRATFPSADDGAGQLRRPSHRSTGCGPTRSTPTSATGSCPLTEDPAGPVRLACRPADEARVFRGAAAHDGVRPPRRGGLPRRGRRAATSRAAPRSSRPPIAEALPDGRLERVRAPQPLRAAGGARPGGRGRRPRSPPGSEPPVPAGVTPHAYPVAMAAAAPHEPLAVEGDLVHGLRAGLPVLGHRPPARAAVGGRHPRHPRARRARAALRASSPPPAPATRPHAASPRRSPSSGTHPEFAGLELDDGGRGRLPRRGRGAARQVLPARGPHHDHARSASS